MVDIGSRTGRDRMSAEKTHAISLSVELGGILQRDHREIANMYRQGYTLDRIVDRLKIQSQYGIRIRKIALNAVDIALSGHRGGFGHGPYEGLISDEERVKLRREHYQNASRVSQSNNTRIFRLNPETGRGLGLEKIQEINASRGITSWVKRREMIGDSACCITDEIESAYFLSQLPEYQHGDLVNNAKIAERLNECYHSGKNVRNWRTVGAMLYVYRKKLDAKIISVIEN
jgi:hypothetical protein